MDVAKDKIDRIITFLNLRKATELRTKADTDEDGVTSGAELDALASNLLSQGYSQSEVTAIMADVNSVLSDSEKKRGDFVFALTGWKHSGRSPLLPHSKF